MEPEELKEKLAGVNCVMVTPFKEDYSLDEDGLRTNTRFLTKNGVNVLIPAGSTGEFWSLTPEEHKRVIKIVVDEARGKSIVVAGTAHSGTKLTVELSQYAEKVGADGVMIVPPYYQKPTIEGIYEHYKTVAESIKIGIVIYNNPWTSKITIRTDLMERLAKIPNIVAVKETSGDLRLAFRLINRLKDRLTFLAGAEILAPFYYMLGAKGHVTATANFAPQISKDLYDAAKEKNWEKMNNVYSILAPYFEFVERLTEKKNGTMYISIAKEAMKMLNLPGWPPRKPLLPLTEEERKELKEILKKMGLLQGQ